MQKILASELIEGVKYTEIEKIVDRHIRNSPNTITDSELYRNVVKELLNKDPKNKKFIKNNATTNNNELNLLSILNNINEDKTHPYDLYKKAGYIKNPEDDFLE